MRIVLIILTALCAVTTIGCLLVQPWYTGITHSRIVDTGWAALIVTFILAWAAEEES